jgi:hypothetical protein
MQWAFEKWDECGGVSNGIERVHNLGVKMMYKAHYSEKNVVVPIVEKRRFHSIMPTFAS